MRSSRRSVHVRTARKYGFFTVAAVVVVASLLVGCTSRDSEESPAAYPTGPLTIMAPGDPGGGWDQHARALQTAIDQARLSDEAVSVTNVPGKSGTVGLTEFAKQKDKNSLMVMGVVMLGGVATNGTDGVLDSVTPIARLTSEYEVLVVPDDSPYENFQDFLAEFKKDPSQIAIAGGSVGGVDQILMVEVAQKIGAPTEKINYMPYAGGGETIPVLLSGKADAGLSGIAQYAEEIEAGRLRPLAVTSKAPTATLPGVDTFINQGVDVWVENWRGIVAPKSISANDRKVVSDFVEKVHDSTGWRRAVTANGWNDRFLLGAEFDKFIDAEQRRVVEVLTELNLAK
ncbi:MAG: Bug family tripartite tricarboxylate transporter substrate binding protein [Actinomycetota bacterium]